MAEVCLAIFSSIVSEGTKTLSEPIIGRMSYVLKCQSYIDGLKERVEELGQRRKRVKILVDQATEQGYEIFADVTEWLGKVEQFTQGYAKHIINDEDEVRKPCFKGLSPNLMSRYKLSKRAVEDAKYAEHLLATGSLLIVSNVSHPPPPKMREFGDMKDYNIFNSRKKIFQDVIEALKDDKLNIIGVCGMGGVGKTTLVKQIAKQVMEDNVFDKVVMAEITKNPDAQKIQGELASDLGMNFDSNDLIYHRAKQLCQRLKKEKRVLIILDNIWTKLELDKIGIPYGDVDEKDKNDDPRRCTIILTSRSRDLLCIDMNSQKMFWIDALSEEEALQLFEKIVGESTKASDFRPLAEEIVGKCGGLPVALSTVANALKNKSPAIWKDALNKLTSSNLREIHGMDADVYSPIKLSYDFLDDEAKSLFLLCGLHREGRPIHVHYLLRYVMGLRYDKGLGLFRNVYTLEAARNRVDALIDNLKASCLLLDGDAEDEAKLHDVIHVVAASIAEEKLMFSIPNVVDFEREMEETIQKGPIAISLPYRDIQELPERLECPQLKLFLLFAKYDSTLQISDHFFEGTEELKVLDFTGIRFSPLPSSLGRLINLQTLCLDGWRLEDIAIVGQLKKLEILSLRGAEIKQLPLQIGQLTRLQLLDLSNCSSLVVIAPNVISKLSRLEELYMGDSFSQWDKDLVLGESLRYRICIGEVWGRWSVKSETSRLMKLQGLENISILLRNHGMKMLLKKTQDLYLQELKGVKNVVPELDDGEGFPRLKHLHVGNFAELLHIVGSIHCKVFPQLESLSLFGLLNLEKICYSQITDQSFINLRIFSVRNCNKLKHLFSFSMAKSLLRLQQIKVGLCNNLEMIIGLNKETSNFGFKEIIAEDDPVQKAILPGLEELELDRLATIEKVWPDQFEGMSCCQNLTKVTVERCHRLKYLINLLTFSMPESFVNLEIMKIVDCKMIEEIIKSQVGIEAKHCIVFRKLKYLRLDCLPSLTSFSSSNYTLEFPFLKQVVVRQCPKMKIFSQGGLLHTPMLNKVQLTEEDDDEGYWEGDLNNTIQKLYYKEVDRVREMTKLELSNFPRFREMWHAQALPVSFFSNLVKLVMDDFKNMTTAIPANLLRCLNKLKILEVRNCDSLEEVLHLEELNVDEHFGPLFPVLDQLELIKLPKLKRFCSFIGNVIELPELLNLNIEDCPNIEKFTCNSISILHRTTNKEPLEITPKENFPLADIQPLFDEKVAFPKLCKLKLSRIPKVSHLWKKISESNKVSKFLNTPVISECKEVVVRQCHNMKIFSQKGRLHTPMLNKVQFTEEDEDEGCWEANLNDTIQKSYDKEVDRVREMTKLELSSFPRLREMWHAQALPVSFFNNLVKLVIDDFTNMTTAIPANLLRCLNKLKILEVRNCDSLEEVLHLEELNADEHFGPLFPVLVQLELINLPKLKRFCSFIGNVIELPELLNLNIENCPNMEIFTCNSISILHRTTNKEPLEITPKENFPLADIQPLFDEKVAFPKLYKLKLSRIPKVSHLWKEISESNKVSMVLNTLVISECSKLRKLVPSLMHLEYLMTLEVSKCHRLTNLLTTSTTKSLVNLEIMKIADCKMIEEILQSHVQEEAKDCIVFRKLRYLGLDCLPSLTSFCSGFYTLEFPSLEDVVVRQCPKMKVFSRGVALYTPLLKKMKMKDAGKQPH
ncbi:AAA domain-containing protein [Citrus sinensis]|nr:AAA domain-containing protein [Citrus sinensis]